MGRCAMIWSTAGTNRVCSRCLALKDTVVGYTDESGVTLPPLHPRCRCTIIYDEIGTPQADKPLTSPAASGNVAPTAVAPVTPAIVGTGITLPPIKPNKPRTPSRQFGDDEKITLNINGFGEAHIPIAKLIKYALNPDKAPDKALAFEKALGYNLSNVDKLIENVVNNINNFRVERKPKTVHGEPFQILMNLLGENGKSALVMTSWIVDAKNSEVRLTSIYVKKKKK